METVQTEQPAQTAQTAQTVKQAIVVDAALNLPPGKLAAQVAHAAVAAFLLADEDSRRIWLGSGMPKVVLGCPGPNELARIERLARRAGLPVAPIRDAGRTIVPAGTPTCVGIGPASAARLRPITGDLRLLP